MSNIATLKREALAARVTGWQGDPLPSKPVAEFAGWAKQMLVDIADANHSAGVCSRMRWALTITIGKLVVEKYSDCIHASDALIEASQIVQTLEAEDERGELGADVQINVRELRT